VSSSARYSTGPAWVGIAPSASSPPATVSASPERQPRLADLRRPGQQVDAFGDQPGHRPPRRGEGLRHQLVRGPRGAQPRRAVDGRGRLVAGPYDSQARGWLAHAASSVPAVSKRESCRPRLRDWRVAADATGSRSGGSSRSSCGLCSRVAAVRAVRRSSMPSSRPMPAGGASADCPRSGQPPRSTRR
jgi:hypothetical protein